MTKTLWQYRPAFMTGFDTAGVKDWNGELTVEVAPWLKPWLDDGAQLEITPNGPRQDCVVARMPNGDPYVVAMINKDDE